VEHWWNDTDRGKTEVLGEKPVTVSLCAPQTPRLTVPGSTKLFRKIEQPFLCLQRLYWSGHAVAQLVEALCYKPEGRGFDSRWCQWKFFL
jgi:hypothetical protein